MKIRICIVCVTVLIQEHSLPLCVENHGPIEVLKLVRNMELKLYNRECHFENKKSCDVKLSLYQALKYR